MRPFSAVISTIAGALAMVTVTVLPYRFWTAGLLGAIVILLIGAVQGLATIAEQQRADSMHDPYRR